MRLFVHGLVPGRREDDNDLMRCGAGDGLFVEDILENEDCATADVPVGSSNGAEDDDDKGDCG